MAQLTRAQLVVALEQSHVAYQRLEAECAALRANVIARRPVRHPESTRYVYSPTVQQQATHNAYVAALLAAKEMAQRTGRVVRL